MTKQPHEAGPGTSGPAGGPDQQDRPDAAPVADEGQTAGATTGDQPGDTAVGAASPPGAAPPSEGAAQAGVPADGGERGTQDDVARAAADETGSDQRGDGEATPASAQEPAHDDAASQAGPEPESESAPEVVAPRADAEGARGSTETQEAERPDTEDLKADADVDADAAVEAVVEVVAELGSLRHQVEERTADLLRVTAEYANYRKRVDRDRALAADNATAAVLLSLLPVLDDLDRAREHGDLVGPFGSVSEQLIAVLGKYSLIAFGSKGDPFDPKVHEAVAHMTSVEVSEPTCVEILRRGYRIGERLLRPAMVAVADPD